MVVVSFKTTETSGTRTANPSSHFFVVLHRSLFVHFVCPLSCLSFDLRLLITPVVSSNFLNFLLGMFIETFDGVSLRCLVMGLNHNIE